MEPPKHFSKLIIHALGLLSPIRSYLPHRHSKLGYLAIPPREHCAGFCKCMQIWIVQLQVEQGLRRNSPIKNSRRFHVRMRKRFQTELWQTKQTKITSAKSSSCFLEDALPSSLGDFLWSLPFYLLSTNILWRPHIWNGPPCIISLFLYSSDLPSILLLGSHKIPHFCLKLKKTK